MTYKNNDQSKNFLDNGYNDFGLNHCPMLSPGDSRSPVLDTKSVRFRPRTVTKHLFTVHVCPQDRYLTFRLSGMVGVTGSPQVIMKSNREPTYPENE